MATEENEAIVRRFVEEVMKGGNLEEGTSTPPRSS